MYKLSFVAFVSLAAFGTAIPLSRSYLQDQINELKDQIDELKAPAFERRAEPFDSIHAGLTAIGMSEPVSTRTANVFLAQLKLGGDKRAGALAMLEQLVKEQQKITEYNNMIAQLTEAELI